MRHLEIIVNDVPVYDGPDNYNPERATHLQELLTGLFAKKDIEIVLTYNDGSRHFVIIEGDKITRRTVKLLENDNL